MIRTKNAVITLLEEDYDFLESISGGAEKYIQMLIKKNIEEKRLEYGYTEMAQINLELADECISADEECALEYEEYLKLNRD